MPRHSFPHLDAERSLAIMTSGKNPDGTPYRLPAEASNAATIAVGEARFFWAGSGRVTLTVAGNMRSTVANPSGSGKKILLARMAAFASAGPAYAQIFANPTGGLPATTPRPVNNAVIGNANPSVAVIRTDVDATVPLSGGPGTGIVFGIPANTRVTLDLPPLVLLPGNLIGVNNAFAGAADVTMTIYWWEEAV